MQDSYTKGADYSGSGKKIAIVAARFNGNIVSALQEAAINTLVQHGVNEQDIKITFVPGAFELPLACKLLAETKKYDGIISLGCVIRGDTPHFDYVCQGATSGIQQVNLDTNVPVAFGVLTTENIEQAKQRASATSLEENKGYDVALCVLEMINLKQSLKQ